MPPAQFFGASVAGTGYAYHLDGKLAGDGVWSYGHDAQRRLVSARRAEMALAHGSRALGRWRSCTMNRLPTLLAALLLLLATGPAPAQPSATALAGMEAYNQGQHARAFALLRAAADAGDAEAMANRGYLHTRGHGVPRNPDEGLRLYREAAARGSSEGMNAIGHRYDHGGTVARDPEAAVRWYCAALTRGNPRALNNLGIMLAYGRGVAVDLPEAISLWHQAAELGHAQAMLNLGVIHLESNGFGPDRALAMHWLLAAARLGQRDAQALLRRLGHTGPFPPAVDHGLRMRPAPEGATGHSSLCGEPIA